MTKSRRLVYHPRTIPRQRGLTVLELLVTVGILSALTGLLLPAVQKTREAARHLQCVHNLRQIGMALHIYHDGHRALPSGLRTDATGETAFGWAAAILPQLDQNNLAAHVRTETSLTAPENDAARLLAPAVFRCPSDPKLTAFDLFAETDHHHQPYGGEDLWLTTLPSTNYLGVFGLSDPDDTPANAGEGTFLGNRTVRLRDLTRGLSQVVIVGERTARKLPSTWIGVVLAGEDAPGQLVGNLWLGPNKSQADECEFDSRHPGRANFLWADGHVNAVADSIDTTLYRNMSRRQ